jgi:inward rectifier potassium channel
LPPGTQRPHPNVRDAVRKGVPASARRDLYFYLMEGSWPRVFVAFAFVFLAANVFFAALYVLEPGSIANARPQSFADAFYFSVQTMGTIGYGTLSPGSDYANGIVTVQAGTTIIGMAIVTGLVFAKASRPKATVLFSSVMVLTTLHGKRALMFRAGNGKGNEIVDATMSVVAMRDEISPEGHHTRRLLDMNLRRARSPMFILSWLAVHEIDEQSPIADVDWARADEHVTSWVVTLIGHDGTYGQTVYARHVYYPEDVRVDHRFVDVMSQLPDGRFMIDYGKFHDTVPDTQASSPARPEPAQA